MTLTELYNSKIDDVQATLGGIRAFKEYCDSFTNKIMMFLEGTDDELHNKSTISVTREISDKEQQLVYITKDNYNAALQDEEASIQVAINSVGATVTMTGEQILDAVEDALGEVKVQSEFLDYLLNNETVRSFEFLSTLRAKLTDVSGDIIDKYARLIVENSALSSIENFFQLSKKTTPTKENEGTQNEYISLVTDAPYVGGNPWGVAFSQIGSEIASFFANAWQGITKLGEFFQAVLKGIVKLVKWFIAKMFKPISTNYEKASPKDGIMDIPLFQKTICQLTKNNDGTYAISSVDNMLSTWTSIQAGEQYGSGNMRGYGCYSYLNYAQITSWNYFQQGMSERTEQLIRYIVAPLIYDLDENTQVLRPYDIIIPTGGETFLFSANDAGFTYDCCLRVGVTDDLKVIIQCFALSNYDEWSEYNDSKNCRILAETLNRLFIFLSDTLGICPNKWIDNIHAESWTSEYYYYISKYFIDTSGLEYDDEGTLELLPRILSLNMDTFLANPASSWVEELGAFLIYGVMAYAGIFGPTFSNDYWPNTSQGSNSLTQLRGLCYYFGDRQGTDAYYGQEYIDVSQEIDVSLIANGFRPYSQYNMFPVSVHYQTHAERVAEAKKYIYGGIIAAAIVVTLVVVRKFTRKRKAKLTLAQGYLDNMSWNLPKNPSAAQMKEFFSAQRRVKRISRVNGMLGVNTSAAAATTAAAGVATLTKQLFAMQGYDDESSTSVTLSTIHRDIIG